MSGVPGKTATVRSRARLIPAFAATLLAASLAACAASPGPPPVEEPVQTTTATATETTTATPEPEDPTAAGEDSISVGIDPLRNGLNPHLLSDDSAFVSSLASLVLPSAFRDGEIDTDVLVSAEEISAAEGVAQTLRYVIQPEAQWSDGTPLTGADFRYLWRSMTQTPGTIDTAAYESIDNVRTTNGGKTVEVDLNRELASWPGLFANLLPSHLLQPSGESFTNVLQNDVPASAGRYLVQTVDRSRGVVTLNRNDRFWGENPALTDILHFREIRTVANGVDQLRSGQVSFHDVTPQETSTDAYSLVADSQVRNLDTSRELQLTMNTSSSVLETAEMRGQLSSLIDVPLLARLATGRSSDLSLPQQRDRSPADPAELQEATDDEPLRIAADPADPTASTAARTLVDLLAQHQISAEVVSAELGEISAVALPEGEVDAVVAWRNSVGTPVDVTSAYHCPTSEGAPRTGNLSGYCLESTDEILEGFLAGAGTTGEIAAFVSGLEELEQLTVPLLRETRVQVLGAGIVGMDEELENWPSGISSAPMWRKQ